MVDALTLIVAAAAASAYLSAPDRSNDPADQSSAAPISPAAGLDLSTANARAIALAQSGHALESLPYFRRQFELIEQAGWSDERLWAAHRDFAAALFNAAMESNGDRPATRSSFERVALVKESLKELALAESKASTVERQAEIQDDRAQTLWVWGLPWDAHLVLEHSASMLANAAPSSVKWRIEGRRRMTREVLEDPTNPNRSW